ncbi:MAG TPA: DUF4268 domain-containing protein [Anaerolineales bacterium]|nr:DUF4268 domain-containing protein [Anaerolineales bacterium]
MEMKEFGIIKKVSLRDIWPKEASDFTPWLAQNLPALSEALGMELELRSREAPVGDFSLDILAHDLGRDRPVIIENQLTPTDHDHLGKLLTYAAGYDAGAVVWVAEEIREEHRQTLDWLNQHTDAAVEFHGVVVEVITIDDSRPAYNFKLVAFPNEWRKSNIRSSVGEASERGELYRRYFQPLVDELREKHHFTRARVAQPQNWYTFSSGIAGITFVNSFAQRGRVRAEIYIDLGEADVNNELFDNLIKSKEEIETASGETLSWERLDNRRGCRIAVYRLGSIEDDQSQLEEIRAWSIDRLLKLRRILLPKLTELIKQTSARGEL